VQSWRAPSTVLGIAYGRILSWVCLWSHPAERSLFQYEFSLESLPKGAVEGRIEWTAPRVERNFYRDKIGTTATEFVRGMYNEASGELSLCGYDKDDPLETIRLDNYRLELSSACDWLFGPAESDGD
jgi:hypothetical protein